MATDSYTYAANARKRSINQLPITPDPNVLHQFASYNTLFTLSALSTQELRNPKTFFQGKPHDIIARSGGISDANFSSHTEASANNRESRRDPTNEFNKTVDKGRVGASLGQASRTFKRDHDLYFRNVELTSVPGFNEKRRLTSVTNITMELVEPSGITLLDKIKAAAANNGFLDHLDAPYMLTIEFVGFDENGQSIKEKSDFIKRVIPVKLITMDIDVNQGGSYYNIKAIPYNEFGFTNNFMYPRTSGSLKSTNRTFKDAVVDLQNILNDQNEQEKDSKFNQYPDKYEISISEDLDPEQQLAYELLQQADMTQTNVNQAPGEEAFEMTFIKFSSAVGIPMLLENLMKTHPKYGAVSFDKWSEAVSKKGSDKFDPNDGLSTYFKYFRIRTSVEPTLDFDEIRQTNRKIIKIVVEPYYISAYNLATAGIHQDRNYQTYVAKAYNYIFTGDNVDIQNLDINYKVAYYQSRLKDLEANDARTFETSNDATTEETGTPTNRTRPDNMPDHLTLLPLKSEVSLYKSSTDGRTGKGDNRVDAFFDAITNPQADMVVINMEILGDPAWLGQSQFIPATPVNSNGSSIDNNLEFFRGGEKTNIWNPKLRCYNYDVAEPVTNLTFKTPQDFNDMTGVYEISNDQRQVFSGLYKVVQVAHSFTDGKFTQNLTMVRFNNQDKSVTKTLNEKIVKKNNVITSVKNPIQLSRENENIWSIREDDRMA